MGRLAPCKRHKKKSGLRSSTTNRNIWQIRRRKLLLPSKNDRASGPSTCCSARRSCFGKKEEQRSMEAHDAAEKKAHQESENRMAKVRKEKANLKKTLYTKHNRVQWQEFEELKEAESAKKEQQ